MAERYFDVIKRPSGRYLAQIVYIFLLCFVSLKVAAKKKKKKIHNAGSKGNERERAPCNRISNKDFFLCNPCIFTRIQPPLMHIII